METHEITYSPIGGTSMPTNFTGRNPGGDRMAEIYADTGNPLYENVRTANGRQLPKALLELALNPDTPQDLIPVLVREAELEHGDLLKEFMPHLNWRNVTHVDIYIRDRHLPPMKGLRGVNLETGESFPREEDPNSLQRRRNDRVEGLKHALQYTEEEILISSLNNQSNTERTEFIEPEVPDKISQALHEFEKATVASGPNAEQRQTDLNAALDTSLSEINKLPEEVPSPEGALAYLIAARSIHDLSATIGIFEEKMSESEALHFRARGLELANDWVQKSARYFLAIYDQPIGIVNEETYERIRRTASEIELYQQYINDALWFSGVYEGDHKKSVDAIKLRTEKSIGKLAVAKVTEALKPAQQESQRLAA